MNLTYAGDGPTLQTRVMIVSASFALAVLCRYVVTFQSGLTNFNTDTAAYFNMARAMLEGEPISYFPNGYSVLVAAAFSLFGNSGTIPALLWLNIVLGAATVAIATAIVARQGATGAILCAVILAAWPNQLNYTRQLLSEVPATFFLVLGVFLSLHRRSLLAGIALGLAVLCRTTLLPVSGSVAILMFLFGNRPGAGWLLAGIITVLIAEMAAIGAGLLAESANLGPNLVISVTSTSSEGINFNPVYTGNPVKIYLGFMFSQPLEFLEQRWSSLWELWGPWPNAGDANTPRSEISRAIIGLRFPLLLMAISCFLLRCWERRRNEAAFYEALVLLSPIAVVTAIHIVFFSTSRFSFTMEPFAITLVAGLLGDLLRRAPSASATSLKPI